MGEEVREYETEVMNPVPLRLSHSSISRDTLRFCVELREMRVGLSRGGGRRRGGDLEESNGGGALRSLVHLNSDCACIPGGE